MRQCGCTFSVVVIVLTANDQMILQKYWLHAQILVEIIFGQENLYKSTDTSTGVLIRSTAIEQTLLCLIEI